MLKELDRAAIEQLIFLQNFEKHRITLGQLWSQAQQRQGLRRETLKFTAYRSPKNAMIDTHLSTGYLFPLEDGDTGMRTFAFIGKEHKTPVVSSPFKDTVILHLTKRHDAQILASDTYALDFRSQTVHRVRQSADSQNWMEPVTPAYAMSLRFWETMELIEKNMSDYIRGNSKS